MKRNTIISILLVVVWIAIPAVVSYRLEVMETKTEILFKEHKLAKQKELEELQRQENALRDAQKTATDFHDDLLKIREKMLRDAEEWINNREMER